MINYYTKQHVINFAPEKKNIPLLSFWNVFYACYWNLTLYSVSSLYDRYFSINRSIYLLDRQKCTQRFFDSVVCVFCAEKVCFFFGYLLRAKFTFITLLRMTKVFSLVFFFLLENVYFHYFWLCCVQSSFITMHWISKVYFFGFL